MYDRSAVVSISRLLTLPTIHAHHLALRSLTDVCLLALVDASWPREGLADGARRPGNILSKAAVGSWDGGNVMETQWLAACGRCGRRVWDGSLSVSVRRKSFSTAGREENSLTMRQFLDSYGVSACLRAMICQDTHGDGGASYV